MILSLSLIGFSLSDLLHSVFCVFIVFKCDLHLILNWMIAIGLFFDLLSVLKILKENQFPNKSPDHNLNFQQKLQEIYPLVIFEKVRISQVHAFLQFHFPFLYLPKKISFTLHFYIKCNIS